MSDTRFLDKNGLLYVWAKIKSTLTGYATTSDLSTHEGNTTIHMTSAEKTKLNGVEAGAEVNIIETVSVNGTALTPTGKAVSITVPTNTNQLTNGAGFQTASEVSAAISDALDDITGISFEIVQSLPASGTAGTIYLISNSGSGSNSYDEYIYVNNAFEKIGTTDVDLSGYAQYSDRITNAEIDTICT